MVRRPTASDNQRLGRPAAARQPAGGNIQILALAFACEPDKGSELGAGWVLSRMLARIGPTCVITRSVYREAIERSRPSVPEAANLRFEYVDLPPITRLGMQDPKGLRPYYFAWQVAAVRAARRLNRQRDFDVVWHLTWSTAWMGSLAPLVGPPFVYGPVAGGVDIPWRLLPELDARGTLYEVVRTLMRGAGRYGNPLARLAWRRARLILVQNPETRAWLPARHRHKAMPFHHVALDAPDEPPRARSGGSPTALFAGRLFGWKGAGLAIRAIALLPGWRLLICGSGPDEARLRRLAEREQVQQRVEFRGWLLREDLLRVMREEADVFLFPSLHDEGGWVIAEALAAALPVVCLNRGGPPVLAGSGGLAVDPTLGVDATAAALAAAVRDAGRGDGAAVGGIGHLTIERRADDLRSLLGRAFPDGDGVDLDRVPGG